MFRCLITGLALATPQGTDAQSNWRNLLAGAVLHETGRVPLAVDSSLPRVSQLAIHVARAAIVNADWTPATISADRTALLIGTSKGPIEAWLTGQPTSAFGLAAVAADVAADIGHGFGARLTCSAACASGLHALIRGKQLIDSGQCDRALIVASESATGPLFEATFHRLGVLARPEIGCRPFDEDREGFLLAEAAAAVCLERSDAPGVAITATSMRSDAHHLTAPDPAGLALAAALRDVAAAGRIDLVHAHGTATLLNDPVELAAIAEVAAYTKVISHKHAIGHTQGTAGLISVVLNVMAHRRGEVFGNTNSNKRLRGDDLLPPAAMQLQCDASIVLAAGFGGPVAAVRLQSMD